MKVRFLLISFLSMGLVACVDSNYVAPVETGREQLNVHNGFYQTKSGDTLYSIAWAMNLDYRQLAEMNHLPPTYQIQPGQQIRVVAAPAPVIVMRPIPRPAQRGQIITRAAPAPRHVIVAVTPAPVKHWAPQEPTRVVKNWIRPTSGRIVSHYSRGLGGNQGVDISGHYGQPIYASASGIVVYSGAGIRGYGNLIIVKHNASYLSAYAFNKRILVKDGSRVRVGQKIAEMGRDDSGRVILHFEIRRNGNPVNPLRYLS